MSVGSMVVIGLLGLVGAYLVVIYNNLVRVKHNVTKAWSNIDVLLKQRHDELPKLVEVCRQYMQYEQATLTQVISARSAVAAARERGDISALGSAEGLLRVGLGQLFALAEAYPELKANSHFQHLQQRISGLEGAIADRREFYNESANLNNIRIEQFPDLIVARLLQFTAKPLLEFSHEERRDVDIKSLFG